MRAVCYARVSSAAQRDRDTIAAQIRMLPEYVARQGWQLVRPVTTYVDDGRSAKSGQLAARTGLAELLRDASAGLFDVVCVVAIDRITRADDLAERGAILGALQKARVKIADLSTGQLLDLSSNFGDLISSFGAIFAADENRKRAERIKAGKVSAIQRGGKPAGPTPYGLAYDRRTRTWAIDPIKAPIVREIFDRIIAGDSCKVIAENFEARGVPGSRDTGLWERTRIWKIARSKHTIGAWVADKARNDIVTVPAIIDAATYAAAQTALIKHRKRGLDKTQHVYLLNSGIGVCGACGAAMLVCSASKNGNRPNRVPAAATYACGNRKIKRRGFARCTADHVKTADADARLWAAVCREIEDPALVDALGAARSAAATDAHDWERDATGYRAHLARLDRVEASILARYRRGAIGDVAFDAELAAIGRERAAVARNLATANDAARFQTARTAQIVGAAELVAQLRAALPTATPLQRRELVRALVEPGGVVFDGHALRITLLIPRSQAIRPVSQTAYKTQHETFMQLRVLAR